MKNTAYVKEIIKENLKDGENNVKELELAVLKIRRECACGGKETCGAKCFSLSENNNIIEANVINNIGAKVGDYVEVEGNSQTILSYAALVFILPLVVGLGLYYGTAALLIENIFAPYIISFVGFLGSIIFLYYFLNKVAKKRKDKDFILVKILNGGTNL